MTATIQDLLQNFPELLKFHSGQMQASVKTCSQPPDARLNSLVFVADSKTLAQVPKNSQATLIVFHKVSDAEVSLLGEATVLKSANVMLAMSRVLAKFFAPYPNRQSFEGQKVHPTAVISKSAKIGKDVIIGPLAVIGENCVIGDNSIIGSHVSLEAQVKIGEHCHIHPQVFIGHACQIGNRCEVHPQTSIGTEGYGYAHDEKGQHYRIPHLGKVILEDDVHIGAGFCIDRGTMGDTVIGRGTKIDNHGHIAHNVRIGENCLITGGFISAGSVTIGDNCIIGGRTTVTGHIRIGNQVQLGGLSGVHESLGDGGQYAGYPIMPLSQSLRVYASLPQLPALRKSLAKVLKHLNLNSND